MAWVQKLDSGNWRGLYRVPGGAVRSAGTYPHKEKALAKAMDAEEAASLPGWRDPRAAGRKWGDWCEEKWWNSRTVAPGTLKRDAGQIKNHIMPRWKNVSLADITRHDIKEWAAQLAKEGLGESSVYRIVSIFSASLAAAMDAEILNYNPAYRLKLPNGETDIVRYFTRTQVSDFIERTEDPRNKALIALLAGTGLRWGEATGLRGGRYDPARRMVRVAEVWDTRSKEEKPYPKGRAIRDVPVPAWVAELVDPYVTSDRIFPAEPALWHKRVWAPLKTGGRVHDLRHTYASWLLQAGIPIAEVSRLMGHSSITITERYAHLAPPKYDAVLAALG